MAITASRLRFWMNLWPPFLGAGIHITELSADFSRVCVQLRQRWYNRNYVNTHFGGSLYAMVDPFWMVLLANRLGPGYVVWDQAAEIRFEKPGRGTVEAAFVLDDATVAEMRAAAAGGEKVLRWLDADVRDASGDVVARVRKQLYVRKKRPAAATASSPPVP